MAAIATSREVNLNYYHVNITVIIIVEINDHKSIQDRLQSPID